MFTAVFFLQSSVQNASTAQNVTSEFQRFNDAIGALGNNVPTVFETLGLALLGILIPLTIAVLQDLLQKKGEEDTNFSVLDLHVILDRVFQVKLLLLFSAFVFVPFVFWDIEIGIGRLFEIGLAIIGIVSILRIILRVYHWTKGNVSSFRLQYLKGLTKPVDMIPVWRSVWNSRKMSFPEEKEYFDIFSQKINDMMKKNEKRN